MDKITRAAQALSDKTRLRIVNLLFERECCVCEVMQALDISQTRASRNLKILSDAGFLNLKIDGSYSLYSLRRNKDGFHRHLLEGVKKGLLNNPSAQKDIMRLNRAKKVTPGLAPVS